MRFRLLRRRLTVSAPRVAIRSALPWPLRWLLGAVVLGFSAALALWAFEFGQDIAGLDRNSKKELAALRSEVQTLRSDLERAQSVADISESLLTTEKAAQDRLTQMIRQLEADNRALRSDLGFFENLIPASGSEVLSIRSLQVERLSEGQLKWQALLIQASKTAPDFNGVIEIELGGLLEGQPWSLDHSDAPQRVSIQRYLRVEGVVDVPPFVVVQTVTARILQGSAVKAVHTVKL
ncbi:MAG: hypothetical protein CVU22_17170 [Betaproteobacteria bacterium HGW-Betaproteobacteria-16]|nr:MAG: hypothetical protein CVU22_17170 [Betaproteobacteria bacterium HGW-Betaproteobacteria-16]